MSVIPLILDETVVDDQNDFNPEGRAVLIQNIQVQQLGAGETSNVSYDLRVGAQCRNLRDRDPKQLGFEGTIILKPRSAVIIQTEENVHLPRGIFGIIAPKVSLLQQGLSTTFSKVDPGYNGHLLITLFNLGPIARTLNKGDGFCAFTALTVEEGARLYNQEGKQLEARNDISRWERLRESLDVNHVSVILILAVVEVGLIIVTAFLGIVELLFLLRSHV